MEGFELILDEDEVIVKTYKPNRKRFCFLEILKVLPFIIIPALIIMFAIFNITGILIFIVEEEGGKPDMMGAIWMAVFGGLFFLGMLWVLFQPTFRYPKALYCVTNKRIIIRHGIIGADFKSLKLKDISAVYVEVNFLDKMVKPNTGTVTFASSATPITQGNQKNGYVPFAFMHVDNPYDVYREVKGFVDDASL